MKSFLLLCVASLMMLTVVSANSCSQTPLSSLLEGTREGNDLNRFAHRQFVDSYKYLLLNMNFNSFLKDRPGFRKLFREQSDKLFDDSINLVKHITNRGLKFNPNAQDISSVFKEQQQIAVTELSSLKLGADAYKRLVKDALSICQHHDAEIKHYFQEEILEDYVKSARKFTGYYNNLNSFGEKDFKFGVYLFDEYLQKQ